MDQRLEEIAINLLEQLIAVGACGLYAAGATFGIVKVIDKVMGLRAAKDDEQEGLDTVLHGEEGYALAHAAARPAVDDEEMIPVVVAPVSETSPALGGE